MLDLVSIFNLMNNYTINNNNVYVKETDKIVFDDDIIDKVKQAYNIYNEARNLYKDELMKMKRTDKNLKYYLELTIEKYSSINEVLENNSKSIK